MDEDKTRTDGDPWNPLDPFPSSRWFYGTWIGAYLAWVIASAAVYFATDPESFGAAVIDTMALFALAMILGAVVTLVGCFAVEKMSWRASGRTAVLAPLYSVGILASLITGT